MENPSPKVANMMLRTSRLTLQPLSENDAADLFEYQSDPETVRFIPWPARTLEQVVESISKVANFSTPKVENDSMVLGWRLSSKGKVIGQSNLTIVSEVNSFAEIGWVVSPHFRGQGFAAEATLALIDFAFDELKLHRLIAYMDQRNSESARLAERLGMRREAAFVKDEFFKGEWTSAYLYALLAEERVAQRNTFNN
jgi:aminoglycoside 6'-N-acetyltransferase